MIGCVACEHVEICPDAYTEVAQYCDELILQAQKQYEEALEKIEGIARGFDSVESSDQEE